MGSCHAQLAQQHRAHFLVLAATTGSETQSFFLFASASGLSTSFMLFSDSPMNLRPSTVSASQALQFIFTIMNKLSPIFIFSFSAHMHFVHSGFGTSPSPTLTERVVDAKSARRANLPTI